MSKKGFNVELLWENSVGVLSAILVIAGLVFGLVWVAQNPAKDGHTKTSPPKNHTTIKASSVDDSQIEQIYAKKRAEMAEKKRAEMAEKERLQNEKKQLEEKRQKLQNLAKQKQLADKKERQKLAKEKRMLAQQKEAAQVAQKKAEKATKEAKKRKKQAEDAEKKAKAEQQKILEQKKIEAEKKRKAEIAEKKRKAEVAKKKRETERAQKKMIAEKKRKAEAEAKRIAAELAADIESREKMAAEAKARQNAIDRFKVAIRDKVNARWVKPANLVGNLSVVLKISVTLVGKVKAVKTSRSSGNKAFDSSAEQAVREASPLPMPEKATWAKEFTNINMKFP